MHARRRRCVRWERRSGRSRRPGRPVLQLTPRPARTPARHRFRPPRRPACRPRRALHANTRGKPPRPACRPRRGPQPSGSGPRRWCGRSRPPPRPGRFCSPGDATRAGAVARRSARTRSVPQGSCRGPQVRRGARTAPAGDWGCCRAGLQTPRVPMADQRQPSRVGVSPLTFPPARSRPRHVGPRPRSPRPLCPQHPRPALGFE